MKVFINVRGLLNREVLDKTLDSPFLFFEEQKINVSSEEWINYVQNYDDNFKNLSCLEYLFEILSEKTKNFAYCDAAIFDLDELMDISEKDKNIIVNLSEPLITSTYYYKKPSPFLKLKSDNDSRDEYFYEIILEICSDYETILSCAKVKEKKLVKEKLEHLSNIIGSYYHI